MLLTDLLSDFERSLRLRNIRPNTIDAYHWAMHDLIDKAMAPAGLRQVTDLNKDVLEEWQLTQLEREWLPGTRALAVTATRQFIRYGIDNEIILDPKSRLQRSLARVKQPEAEPHPIPAEDLLKIEQYLLPLSSDTTIEHLRNRALFIYILTTGARVSEALQPNRSNYAKPKVIQKGGGPKVLGVSKEAAEVVGDYLYMRDDDRPELFVIHAKRRHLEPMKPADVRLVWHKMSEHLGLTYWTTHAIRHTCATVLLAAGVDHLVIAKHLGHHGVGTIANYAEVGEAGRQQVLQVMGHLIQLPEHIPQEAA